MIKAQILVVEDQAVTAALILEVLKDEGYDAQIVDTLAKARARLKTAPPELLILDRNLPDGDGVDLLAEIRSDEKLAAMPVIILTAKKDVADKVAGLRTGADDYVAKPFNTEELVARVEALLRRSGKGSQPAVLEAAGIKLDNTGHFHIIVGNNVPAVGVVIPPNDAVFRHYGTGAIETKLTLPAGTHTLRLVLGDFEHKVISADLISAPITITVK